MALTTANVSLWNIHAQVYEDDGSNDMLFSINDLTEDTPHGS